MSLARSGGRHGARPVRSEARARNGPKEIKMTTSAEHNLMDWLRDAHAMEEHAETMLMTTASRLENYPEVRVQFEKHINETREQARLIKTCIDRRGGRTSAVKDLAAKAVATGQGLSGLFVSDEIVKAAMATYTFQHVQIAAYRVLIAAAELLEDVDTKHVCETILAQEQAMANWLTEHLPDITQRFLVRAATPRATAKH